MTVRALESQGSPSSNAARAATTPRWPAWNGVSGGSFASKARVASETAIIIAALSPATFHAFEADVRTTEVRTAASETVGNGRWTAPGSVRGACISSLSTVTPCFAASRAIAARASRP